MVVIQIEGLAVDILRITLETTNRLALTTITARTTGC